MGKEKIAPPASTKDGTQPRGKSAPQTPAAQNATSQKGQLQRPAAAAVSTKELEKEPDRAASRGRSAKSPAAATPSAKPAGTRNASPSATATLSASAAASPKIASKPAAKDNQASKSMPKTPQKGSTQPGNAGSAQQPNTRGAAAPAGEPKKAATATATAPRGRGASANASESRSQPNAQPIASGSKTISRSDAPTNTTRDATRTPNQKQDGHVRAKSETAKKTDTGSNQSTAAKSREGDRSRTTSSPTKPLEAAQTKAKNVSGSTQSRDSNLKTAGASRPRSATADPPVAKPRARERSAQPVPKKTPEKATAAIPKASLASKKGQATDSQRKSEPISQKKQPGTTAANHLQQKPSESLKKDGLKPHPQKDASGSKLTQADKPADGPRAPSNANTARSSGVAERPSRLPTKIGAAPRQGTSKVRVSSLDPIPGSPAHSEVKASVPGAASRAKADASKVAAKTTPAASIKSSALPQPVSQNATTKPSQPTTTKLPQPSIEKAAAPEAKHNAATSSDTGSKPLNTVRTKSASAQPSQVATKPVPKTAPSAPQSPEVRRGKEKAAHPSEDHKRSATSPTLSEKHVTATAGARGKSAVGSKRGAGGARHSHLPVAKRSDHRAPTEVIKSLSRSVKQMQELSQVMAGPRGSIARRKMRDSYNSYKGHSQQSTGDGHLPTIEERHLQLYKSELEVERDERAKVERSNAELHQQIAVLQKRVLKEQEKTKMFPKVTSVVPTSLEANIHLRYQYQKNLDNEREKYTALEVENQRLGQEIRELSKRILKDKRVQSIEEHAQHANEIAFWRIKIKEHESEKDMLRDKLANVERLLVKETKEKERIFKEMITMRRLQMHLSNKLEGPNSPPINHYSIDSQNGDTGRLSGAHAGGAGRDTGKQYDADAEFDANLTSGYLRSIGVNVKPNAEADDLHHANEKDAMQRAIQRAKSATPGRSTIKAGHSSAAGHEKDAQVDPGEHAATDARQNKPAASATNSTTGAQQKHVRLEETPHDMPYGTSALSPAPSRPASIKKGAAPVIENKNLGFSPIIEHSAVPQSGHPASGTINDTLKVSRSTSRAASPAAAPDAHSIDPQSNKPAQRAFTAGASTTHQPPIVPDTQARPSTATSANSEARDRVPSALPKLKRGVDTDGGETSSITSTTSTSKPATGSKFRRSRQPSEEDSIRAAKIQIEYDAYVSNKDTQPKSAAAAGSVKANNTSSNINQETQRAATTQSVVNPALPEPETRSTRGKSAKSREPSAKNMETSTTKPGTAPTSPPMSSPLPTPASAPQTTKLRRR